MPKSTTQPLKVGDRVYVGNETRHGTVVEIAPNGSTRILFDRSGRDVLIPPGDAQLLPDGPPPTKQTRRDTLMGGFGYHCIFCGNEFWRKTKLDESRYQPRCPTCHAMDRKASKRQTWRDHSEQYYAARKARKAALKATQTGPSEDSSAVVTRQAPEAPEIAPEMPEIPLKPATTHTRGTFRGRLPDGRQIVWMG